MKNKFRLFLCAVALAIASHHSASAVSDSLIATNAAWKYLDNGSNQGTTWKATGFNDASWATGNAELGYGDGDEATVVSYGGSANNKYITTYFRKSFTVPNAALYSSLTFGLVRDDGAIIYLNGTEVYRTNMPTGSVNFKTKATADITGANENSFVYFTIAANLLVNGINNVSVEIHQFDKNSPDISFKLNLAALQSTLCNAPGGLNTTNITTNSATLNWYAVSGAVDYSVQYRIVGNPTWSSAASTTTSANISSLSPSSNYEWQVQTNCGNNNLSGLSVLSFFTTSTPACNTPTGLNATNITTTSATLNWVSVGGAISYNVQYRIAGNPTWSTTTSAANSANLSSLSPTSNYEWRIQANCGNNNLSTFSSLSNFTTSTPVCNTPSGLGTTNITSVSATFNWVAVSGAVSYNVQYRIIGNPSWSSTTASTNTVNASSLSPAANYEWQVQTVCSSNPSAYSQIASFTTLPPVCPVPTGTITHSISSTFAVLRWNALAEAMSYNVRYKPVSSSTWTTVNTSQTYFDLTGLAPFTNYEWQVQSACNASPSTFTSSVTFTTLSASTYDSLITPGATWKYNDSGLNLGTSWRGTGYNDATWAQGPSQLGYGDGDEATVVSYGPDANNKYITTYFRKSFSITNAASYLSLTLNIVRDDGAVVYLNGTEIYRANMPTGTIAYNTFASAAISGTDESAWYTANVNPSLLVNGTNTIAVEMHQVNLTSSDISFDFRLLASRVPTVTRGPYLQTITPTSIVICWQTSTATASRVRCGTSASAYTMNFFDATAVTDHFVTLTGLTPSIGYYYTVENQLYFLQGNSGNYFLTPPPAETVAPVRIWAIGDFGNASAGQLAVRDAYAAYADATYTNLWIWMGDNAYTTGTDAEYQAKVFDIYPQQFKKMPLYPSPGNHDYGNTGYQSASVLGINFPYFRIFAVPTAAEAGGMASGTEKFYSYNYANIHFISLDSYGAFNGPGSPMYNWLVSDLEDSRQRWTIVYFHHPPYTKGSHDSDSDDELINMRQNIIPVLESFGVDLVLSGHSHVNERTALIKGHYGASGTFNSSMIIQGGSGAQPNPYVKVPPYYGTVYAVCGTSGQLSSSVQAGWPMPCMYYSNNTNNASVVIDVTGDQLDCKYLASNGTVIDQFTILKVGSQRGVPSAENEEPALLIYPNPFTDETVISYTLAKDETTELDIFNVTGEKIYSFTNGKTLQRKGEHEFKLSPSLHRLSPGIYSVRLIAGENISIEKIVFVK